LLFALLKIDNTQVAGHSETAKFGDAIKEVQAVSSRKILHHNHQFAWVVPVELL